MLLLVSLTIGLKNQTQKGYLISLMSQWKSDFEIGPQIFICILYVK